MKSIVPGVKKTFIEKHGEELYNFLSDVVSKEMELIECMIAKRQELKMTQSDLAKAIRTTQAQISRYESMERSPSLRVLLKILNVLEIDINLLDKEGNVLESKWK